MRSIMTAPHLELTTPVPTLPAELYLDKGSFSGEKYKFVFFLSKQMQTETCLHSHYLGSTLP